MTPAELAAKVLELANLALVDVADKSEIGEPAFCVKCHIHVVTDPELEPSPMCNPCAQDSLVVLARSVLTMEKIVEAAREWRKSGGNSCGQAGCGCTECRLCIALAALHPTEVT